MRELEVVQKTADQPAKIKQKMKLRASGLARFVLGPIGRTLIILVSILVIAGLSVFTYFYAKYAAVIDEKLRAGVFANSARIFAAPQSVAVGDAGSPQEIAAELRRSGYTESRDNTVGYYQLRPNAIEVFPHADSYFDQEPGVLLKSGSRLMVSCGRSTSGIWMSVSMNQLWTMSSVSRVVPPTF